MKFVEFEAEYDKYGAYRTWRTFADARESGMIPEKYHEYFPDLCECGSENIISPNLKRCMCCNPRCCIKEACKLSEMMDRFGFKGFGEKKCAMILTGLRNEDEKRRKAIKADPDCGLRPLFVYNSYVEVIAVDYMEYPPALRSSAAGIDFAGACMQLFSMSVTFPQLVSKLGIMSLGKNALDLFSGINSFREFMQCAKNDGGLRAFCAMRGVYDIELIGSLREALMDIGIADAILRKSIRREGLKKVDICITGRVNLDGVKYTKDKFIQKLNHLCVDKDGVQLYEFHMGSAVQSAPFVVYSDASASAKFVAGRERGIITDEFGTHSVLITADEVYALLKGIMQKWNAGLDVYNVSGAGQLQ